jgi:hypothetical protein
MSLYTRIRNNPHPPKIVIATEECFMLRVARRRGVESTLAHTAHQTRTVVTVCFDHCVILIEYGQSRGVVHPIHAYTTCRLRLHFTGCEPVHCQHGASTRRHTVRTRELCTTPACATRTRCNIRACVGTGEHACTLTWCASGDRAILVRRIVEHIVIDEFKVTHS